MEAFRQRDGQNRRGDGRAQSSRRPGRLRFTAEAYLPRPSRGTSPRSRTPRPAAPPGLAEIYDSVGSIEIEGGAPRRHALADPRCDEGPDHRADVRGLEGRVVVRVVAAGRRGAHPPAARPVLAGVVGGAASRRKIRFSSTRPASRTRCGRPGSPWPGGWIEPSKPASTTGGCSVAPPASTSTTTGRRWPATRRRCSPASTRRCSDRSSSGSVRSSDSRPRLDTRPASGRRPASRGCWWTVRTPGFSASVSRCRVCRTVSVSSTRNPRWKPSGHGCRRSAAGGPARTPPRPRGRRWPGCGGPSGAPDRRTSRRT